MSEPIVSWWPLATLVLPLLGAFACLGWPAGAGPGWRRPFILTCSALTAVLAFAFLPGVLRGDTLAFRLLQLTPQAWIEFRVDAAGVLYAATAALLWFLALIYAFGYLHGPNLPRVFATLMACLAAAMGVAFAANLLSFFVFYELLSVLTYVLVVHEETPAALAAGLKYLGFVLVGGSLVLCGVLLTFAVGGDLTFVGGGVLPADAATVSLLITFACFVLGFGVKAALMPLHGWVPDAHPAAPAPCSALLSGVMVAAGSFGLIRVVFEVFGVGLLRDLGVMPWLGGLASVTVVLGAVLALGQDDLKRRLAYSTISQMGYVTLALSLLGPVATMGALVHIVHHAFMKGALFFCAGTFANATGSRSMGALVGLARRTPVAAASFVLVTIGMIGVPPLSGFVSKWHLGLGMLESGAPYTLVVLLLGALLAAGYLLPVSIALYSDEANGAPRAGASEVDAVPSQEAPEVDAVPSQGASEVDAVPSQETPEFDPADRAEGGEKRVSLVVATAAAASMTIVLGLAASVGGLPTDVARLAAERFFGGG